MRRRNILIALLLIAAAGGFLGYRMYSAKVPTAEGKTPEAAIQAKDLYAAFVRDESAAGERYNDKLVEVAGSVREIKQDAHGRSSVLLDTGDPLGAVVCEFPENVHVDSKAEFGTVRIKGYCAGYNLDVLLQRCAWGE